MSTYRTQKSYSAVTFTCHFQLSCSCLVMFSCYIKLSCSPVMFNCHNQLPCSAVMYSCHVQLSCTAVMFSCHVQLSCSAVMFSCHVQLSAVKDTHYCCYQQALLSLCGVIFSLLTHWKDKPKAQRLLDLTPRYTLTHLLKQLILQCFCGQLNLQSSWL